MKVIWSPEAQRRLSEILAYIAQDSPDNASRFVAKLIKRAQDIETFPNQGRKVPERESDDLREVIEGNYRIIYRLKSQVIEIVTVFEGHRLLKDEEAPKTAKD